MHRLFAVASFLGMALCFGSLPAGEKGDDPREALQNLQDFIGNWDGNGTSEVNKNEIWKEAIHWTWRFKGKDVSLAVDMPSSKQFKTGEVRFLSDKGLYQMTLVDKADVKQEYVGEWKKNALTLERVDPTTKETQQLKLNAAAGGVRLVLTYSTKPENRTLYNKQFQVAYTREGEVFGASAKKIECIVTGGLGTIPVMYMGQTYYVCCTGCRDAFNDNPAKILAEYTAKKRGGK